jgi:molecular chaperone DnaK
MPQIEVSFDIDANGILNVSARDKATGKEQKITIQSSSGLNETEIKRMVREAEQNVDADKARRELVEARNKIDALAFQTEKTLADGAEKVPVDVKARVESALQQARSASGGEDRASIESAMKELQDASHAMATAMYQAAAGSGQQGGGSAGGEGARKDDDVIDAEYEDVK